MKSSPRQRIRPVSRETRFQRIRGLKCFEEVHQRILDGWAPSRLAKFIQEERKECLDITQPSLDTQLGEYRASLPKGEVAQKFMPPFMQAALEQVDKDFNSLDEARKLYQMQLKRVNIDLAKEEKIGKLFPSMTQEIRAAREILSDISALEMDLGLNKRHLGQVDVEARVLTDVTARYDDATGQLVQDPESRRKLLGIAERFRSLAAGQAHEVDNTPPQEENAELVIDAEGVAVEKSE